MLAVRTKREALSSSLSLNAALLDVAVELPAMVPVGVELPAVGPPVAPEPPFPLLLLPSRAKPDDLHPSSISVLNVKKTMWQREPREPHTLVSILSVGLERICIDSG